MSLSKSLKRAAELVEVDPTRYSDAAELRRAVRRAERDMNKQWQEDRAALKKEEMEFFTDRGWNIAPDWKSATAEVTDAEYRSVMTRGSNVFELAANAIRDKRCMDCGKPNDNGYPTCSPCELGPLRA